MSSRELTLLSGGRIEVLGRILRSSNETFLVRISCGADSARAVYKPEAGERPLSDFEPGLYRREVAAYFTLYAEAPHTHCILSQIALFDYVANNTDRKSGHVLRGDDGRVWGIDHGLCFSAAFKLRTVIWDFAGLPIPDALMEDITPLAEAIPPDVAGLLDDTEVTALQRRVKRVLREGVLPVDRTGMRYPWPLV